MKKVLIILSLIIFIIPLSGCYDKREVNEQTYVIAMGFDKGKTNILRLTLQYAIPKAIGAGGGGSGSSSGGGGDKSLGEVTVEAPNLYAGLTMANNFIGRQMNISHAKVAVFSEEIAKDGSMWKYIHGMRRGREFRPNLDIAISRDSAEKYIQSIKPVQEVDPAKYYELKFSNFIYTGFAANTQFHTFYYDQENLDSQPIATLVGVGNYKTIEEVDSSKSTVSQKGRLYPLEGDYKAGDVPKVGDISGQTMGLAAFKGNKMVGELDGGEATSYLLSTGYFKHAYVTIPDPIKKDSYIVINLRQNRIPKRKVEIVNGNPKISLTMNVEADFLSIQSGIDYEYTYLESFEKFTSEFLKEEILRFLNRTSKELKSDICGFGSNAKMNFLTWDDWKKVEWLSKYKDSEFDVEVNFKIRRTGLMIRSISSIGGE